MNPDPKTGEGTTAAEVFRMRPALTESRPSRADQRDPGTDVFKCRCPFVDRCLDAMLAKRNA